MNSLTREQQDFLQTWSAKRDALLLAVSEARKEYDVLFKKNFQLTGENSSLVEELIGHKKAIEIMEEHESERSVLVSRDLAMLTNQKVKLQSEVTSIENDVENLLRKKREITSDIELLTPLHEKFTAQIRALEHTVEHVVKVNEKNTDKVNIMIARVEKFLLGLTKSK